MEPNALASWVTAGAAVVYTAGTFLLWRTTKKSLDAMQAAFKLNFLLAYLDAGGGQGVMGRLVASQSDRVKAHALNELLQKAFPEEYEELKTAMQEKPEAAPPSV